MNARKGIFLLFMLVLLGYFVYELRGVVFSPRLTIYEPQSGDTLSSPQLRIAGRTDPYMKVSVAGYMIQANEKGAFDSTFPIGLGYSEIGVSVKDRFENETKKVLKLFVD